MGKGPHNRGIALTIANESETDAWERERSRAILRATPVLRTLPHYLSA